MYVRNSKKEKSWVEILSFWKSTLRSIFYHLPFSSSLANKKIFRTKKHVIADLDCKIDANDGKKWVKFVAMQKNNATLINDLNTMRGTVESYLKTIAQRAIQNCTVPSLIAPSSTSLKKQKTVLSHLKERRKIFK